MSALVYQAINAVAGELATGGIAKSQRNEEGDYVYRGIEDVLKALAPLLAAHRLCVLPRVLEREAAGAGADQRVVLRVAFDLVSAIDGSTHVIESFGEAIDDSDKGTAKAMSAAYKAAMLQAFCIPVPQEEADSSSPRLKGKPFARTTEPTTTATPEPPEGWESWSAEVIAIATSCESGEAIDRLLGKRRKQLSALQRGRPELYARIGEAVATRLAELQRPTGKPTAEQPDRTKTEPAAEQPDNANTAAAPERKGHKQAKTDAPAATAQAA